VYSQFLLIFFLDDQSSLWLQHKTEKGNTGSQLGAAESRTSTYIAGEHSHQMCTKPSQVVYGSSHGAVRIMQSLIN
jgi:hypothetical protein